MVDLERRLRYEPNIPDPNRDIWTHVSDGSDPLVLSSYSWDEIQQVGSRWYKGDCHLHTTMSDGNLTPDQMNRQAKEAGLDFIVATDHFIMPTSWPKTDLLVIPGTEVTTQAGHWNALGFRRWFNWNPNAADGGMATEQGMNRLIREASDAGIVCSINHPASSTFEWTFHETDMSRIHAMEIIHMPEKPGAEQSTERALVIWSTLWNEGYRITGIGGSDFHFNEPYYTGGDEPRVGSSTTCVFAPNLSARNILNGIRAGCVYVTRGPELDAVILIEGISYRPGSDLTEAVNVSKDGIVRCQIQVSGMKEGFLCWIENGKQVKSVEINDGGTFEANFVWKGREYVWARAEIRSVDGELIAVTNPVSYGARSSELYTWEQIMIKAGFTMIDLKQTNSLGW